MIEPLISNLIGAKKSRDWSPKRTNSIPVSSSVVSRSYLDRDTPFFLSTTINAHYNGSLCVFCIFQNNSSNPNMRVDGRVSGRQGP